jgi:hypothetical protein
MWTCAPDTDSLEVLKLGSHVTGCEEVSHGDGADRALEWEMRDSFRVHHCFDLTVLFLGPFLKLCQDVNPWMFTAAVFIIERDWKQFRCPAVGPWLAYAVLFTIKYFLVLRWLGQL